MPKFNSAKIAFCSSDVFVASDKITLRSILLTIGLVTKKFHAGHLTGFMFKVVDELSIV